MCSLESKDEKLAGIIFRVILFYKGAISLEAASNLPLPLLFEAEYHAADIAEENRKARKRK